VRGVHIRGLGITTRIGRGGVRVGRGLVRRRVVAVSRPRVRARGVVYVVIASSHGAVRIARLIAVVALGGNRRRHVSAGVRAQTMGVWRDARAGPRGVPGVISLPAVSGVLVERGSLRHVWPRGGCEEVCFRTGSLDEDDERIFTSGSSPVGLRGVAM
jgi:hypothetical protein